MNAFTGFPRIAGADVLTWSRSSQWRGLLRQGRQPFRSTITALSRTRILPATFKPLHAECRSAVNRLVEGLARHIPLCSARPRLRSHCSHHGIT